MHIVSKEYLQSWNNGETELIPGDWDYAKPRCFGSQQNFVTETKAYDDSDCGFDSTFEVVQGDEELEVLDSSFEESIEEVPSRYEQKKNEALAKELQAEWLNKKEWLGILPEEES
jgi:hypothetical protein